MAYNVCDNTGSQGCHLRLWQQIAKNLAESSAPLQLSFLERTIFWKHGLVSNMRTPRNEAS